MTRPAPSPRPDAATARPWRCFFCDEEFTDPSAASDHFGMREGDRPACCIDTQELHKLRELEKENRRLWADIHNEKTIYEAHHAMVRSELHSFNPFRECNTINDAFNRYDSLEGEKLALDEKIARLQSAIAAVNTCEGGTESRLREALKFYARESTYHTTCAMDGGIPIEVPHLIIEEDGGKLAREALSASTAPSAAPVPAAFEPGLADLIFDSLTAYRCLLHRADDGEGSGASLLDVIANFNDAPTVSDAKEELSELAAHIASDISVRPVPAAAMGKIREALISGIGALTLDHMVQDDGTPYGTTTIAINEMIGARDMLDALAAEGGADA